MMKTFLFAAALASLALAGGCATGFFHAPEWLRGHKARKARFAHEATYHWA